jgi:uncharacterized protein
MKLYAHPIAERAITHITLNSLTIAGSVHHTSVQISQNRGASAWPIHHVDAISEADILDWIAQKPELVIVGSGKTHRFLPAKWQVLLSQGGIGVESMTTGAAARTYNVLLDEGRNVLGAFIVETP